MNKHYFIIVILITICLSACDANKESKQLSDTTQIISKIFTENTKFADRFFSGSLDTIYIIKTNKYFNQAWPSQLNKIEFIYIDNLPNNRYFNKPGSGKLDLRERFEFGKFEIKSDSAFVNVIYYNSPTNFSYKLVKKKGVWVITDNNYNLFNPIHAVGNEQQSR